MQQQIHSTGISKHTSEACTHTEQLSQVTGYMHLFACIALTVANNLTALELFAVFCWELWAVIVDLRIHQQRDRHVEVFQNVKKTPSSNPASGPCVNRKSKPRPSKEPGCVMPRQTTHADNTCYHTRAKSSSAHLVRYLEPVSRLSLCQTRSVRGSQRCIRLVWPRSASRTPYAY